MQKKLLTSKKKAVYICLSNVRRYLMAGWQSGYAEDCKSFYIGSIPVPASRIRMLFRLSSAVEQSAVNRSVVGSNPTAGAKVKHPKGCFFLCPEKQCLLNQPRCWKFRNRSYFRDYCPKSCYPIERCFWGSVDINYLLCFVIP